MIKFLYKFGLISFISFIISNLFYFAFEKILNPSVASLFTIIIVFFINTHLFFKTEIFNETKKNYYKLLTLTILFRIFEYLLFNFLYLFIFVNIKTNYIFLLTLIISFVIKTAVYYKISKNSK